LVNIAWTKNAEFIHTGYTPLQSDTLKIIAYIVNPQNHPVQLYAIISGQSTAYSDSVFLFDDGMQGDENPNDNIWGNSIILSGIPEDHYYADIFTEDLFEGTMQKYSKINNYLLRKGPVVLDHYRITSSDTIPHHGDRLKFEFTLRNEGTTASVKNITSQVVCQDTFASLPVVTTTSYSEIPAGSTSVGNGQQYIKFNANAPDSVYARFKVYVSSDEFIFWSDSFSVFVHKDPTGVHDEYKVIPKRFALKQNHPNPFNPITTIEFTLPESEFVELKVYNVLGKEVSTLVSKKMNQGIYTCTFDGTNLASGIYYYQLVAGDLSTGASRAASRGSGQRYREVKKMILIK